MKHAIAVGGTGMLAEATHWLAGTGYQVSVLSRWASRFCGEDPRLRAFDVDWSDEPAFLAALERALQTPAGLALVWCHRSWQDVPLRIAEAMGQLSNAFDVYLVLGSAVSDPARPELLEEIKNRFGQIPGCALHLILLGFVREDAGSRWLHDGEIAQGTIEAMTSQAPQTTVGTVRPWDARP